jgi:predicted DsbA family dithiol-disulfide isomerase
MKFGSTERSRKIDERVAGAAANVGLGFRLDLMLRTPNTLDAHRLIWLAGRENVQDAVMESVFAAYFTQGRDIGDRDVLAGCAAQAGMDRAAVADFLAGDVAAQEMLAADRAAREAGVNGVPSFFLDGYGLYSGAMPAETMAEALRKGHHILRQRAA